MKSSLIENISHVNQKADKNMILENLNEKLV